MIFVTSKPDFFKVPRQVARWLYPNFRETLVAGLRGVGLGPLVGLRQRVRPRRPDEDAPGRARPRERRQALPPAGPAPRLPRRQVPQAQSQVGPQRSGATAAGRAERRAARQRQQRHQDESALSLRRGPGARSDQRPFSKFNYTACLSRALLQARSHHLAPSKCYINPRSPDARGPFRSTPAAIGSESVARKDAAPKAGKISSTSSRTDAKRKRSPKRNNPFELARGSPRT
ncbi:unnamed protein product [Trichogramma brassicae]|uniref:Uncharacterized protein n=1 Tax=Trichogramma brassicae TaxID=86971 RepID=A0A6H5ILA1_9HYME|nr:unnamed protein product [Trichogramma brassicae]